MNTGTTYIIGLDLGDGESAIAYVPVDDTGEPSVFTAPSGERSIITAFAEAEGTPLIGRDALLRGGVTELALSFKEEPDSTTPRGRNLGNKLLRFAEELYLLFVRTHLGEDPAAIADRVRVYIGRPAGWTDRAVEEYRKLFRDSRYIPKAEVVPESQSAFIQVRDYHGVSPSQLDSVLVVDIGSSTTDLTFVKQLRAFNLPVGKTLGGRLIDQMLKEQVIEGYRAPQRLRDRLEDKDRDRAFLLYLCRKAKEAHFSEEPFTPVAETESFQWMIDNCWPLLHNLDMDDVLRRPLTDFRAGWKEGFRELLEDARRQILPDVPKVVLLTGGGSRMPFTAEVCREVFPRSIVNPDHDPSLSVARGLAGYGRWRYRVNNFKEAVRRFIDSAELDREVRVHTGPLGKSVFDFMMRNAVDAVLRPMVHELQDGTLSSQDIGDYMEHFYGRYSAWLETPEGLRQQREVLDGFSTKLQPFLRRHTATICERFSIPKGSLEFTLVLPARQFFEEKLRGLNVFDEMGAKAMKLMISAADNVVPKWARKMVPRGLVDTAMDAEKLFKDGIRMAIGDFIKLTPQQLELFVTDIRGQIERQLLEKAREAEALLI